MRLPLARLPWGRGLPLIRGITTLCGRETCALSEPMDPDCAISTGQPLVRRAREGFTSCRLTFPCLHSAREAQCFLVGPSP